MTIRNHGLGMIGLAALVLACGLFIAKGQPAPNDEKPMLPNDPMSPNDEIVELQQRCSKLEAEREAIQKDVKTMADQLAEFRRQLIEDVSRKVADAETRSKEAIAHLSSRMDVEGSNTIGTIVAFVGEWPTDENVKRLWRDAGWALCNGDEFDSGECKRLFGLLKSNHLPDLQGYFLRGIDRKVEELESKYKLVLHLTPSLDDVGSIPNEGKSLLIVAEVRKNLHFRILDSVGKIVVDTDETKLTGEAERIQMLKLHLSGLWRHANTGLSTSESQMIISACKFILDIGRRDPDGVRAPGSRQRHATALPTTDYFSTEPGGWFDPAEGDHAFLLKVDGKKTVKEDDSTDNQPNLQFPGRIREIPNHIHEIMGGDVETRSLNRAVHWLIKIK